MALVTFTVDVPGHTAEQVENSFAGVGREVARLVRNVVGVDDDITVSVSVKDPAKAKKAPAKTKAKASAKAK